MGKQNQYHGRYQITYCTDHISSETDPPLEIPSREADESTREVPPPDAPERDPDDPGPDGDDTSIQKFCEERGTPSGVERAAATDPSAFRVSCSDLVSGPSGGDDCTILEWARPEDFQGALEPSGNNCGPFEQPDADGNCGPANAIEKMRGLTAEIASLNLPGLVLCPPIVCNPNPVEADNMRHAISSTDVGPLQCPPLIATSETEISSDGEVINLTLCNTGPGSKYKTVSSLKVGDVVEILGVGAAEGWLVVDNPIYAGEACWVPEEDIDVSPQLDLGSLTVFGVPNLPGNGNSQDNSCTLTASICANQGYNNFDSTNCKCY